MRVLKQKLLVDKPLAERVHVVVHVRGVLEQAHDCHAEDDAADPDNRHFVHVQLVHCVADLGRCPLKLLRLHDIRQRRALARLPMPPLPHDLLWLRRFLCGLSPATSCVSLCSSFVVYHDGGCGLTAPSSGVDSTRWSCKSSSSNSTPLIAPVPFLLRYFGNAQSVEEG